MQFWRLAVCVLFVFVHMDEAMCYAGSKGMNVFVSDLVFGLHICNPQTQISRQVFDSRFS